MPTEEKKFADLLQRFQETLAKGGKKAKLLQERLTRLEQIERDGVDPLLSHADEVKKLEADLSEAKADHAAASQRAREAKKRVNEIADNLHSSIRTGWHQPSLPFEETEEVSPASLNGHAATNGVHKPINRLSGLLGKPTRKPKAKPVATKPARKVKGKSSRKSLVS